MQLRLLNFTALVQNMAAATQAASAQLLDLTIGSILRAVLEANAGIALWLQWLITRVLQTTRAATSAGADLDSFVADFSLTRLQAVAATGTVTFARLTPGLAAAIPQGAMVRTADGTQDFLTTLATDLAADATSIDVPVQAATAGAGGNVQAGAISLLATAIPGVDSVSNLVAIQGGRDAESDPALRSRFQSFLDTRARATTRAIGYAIGQIQQGLEYLIEENTDTAGNYRPGSFVVTVDDGSGTPSTKLISEVASAIETVRPIGSNFAVQPPEIVPVDISLSLVLAPGTNQPLIVSATAQAIAAYATALPIGAALTRSRIAQLAHDADTAVLNATNILLNNVATDIAPSAHGVIKPNAVVVS